MKRENLPAAAELSRMVDVYEKMLLSLGRDDVTVTIEVKIPDGSIACTTWAPLSRERARDILIALQNQAQSELMDLGVDD